MHARFEAGFLNVSVIGSSQYPAEPCEYPGFEQASQPLLSDIERRNLLNFCIVGKLVTKYECINAHLLTGGGPTGIEFSAELHDLIHSDIVRHYPSLARLCKITVYDVAPHILGSFDQNLRRWGTSSFAFFVQGTDV